MSIHEDNFISTTAGGGGGGGTFPPSSSLRRDKRTRCENFGSDERQLLIELIDKHIRKQEKEHGQLFSNRGKSRAWQVITKEFNCFYPEKCRSRPQLKGLYRRLKKMGFLSSITSNSNNNETLLGRKSTTTTATTTTSSSAAIKTNNNNNPPGSDISDCFIHEPSSSLPGTAVIASILNHPTITTTARTTTTTTSSPSVITGPDIVDINLWSRQLKDKSLVIPLLAPRDRINLDDEDDDDYEDDEDLDDEEEDEDEICLSNHNSNHQRNNNHHVHHNHHPFHQQQQQQLLPQQHSQLFHENPTNSAVAAGEDYELIQMKKQTEKLKQKVLHKKLHLLKLKIASFYPSNNNNNNNNITNHCHNHNQSIIDKHSAS